MEAIEDFEIASITLAYIGKLIDTHPLSALVTPLDDIKEVLLKHPHGINHFPGSADGFSYLGMTHKTLRSVNAGKVIS